MNNWNPYPFFRLIIPFAMGILLAININFQFEFFRLYSLISLILLLFAVLIFYRVGNWRNQWLSGFFIYLFVGFAGFALVHFNSPKYNKSNISNLDNGYDHFVIRITEPLSEKANSFKSVGELMFANDTSGLEKISGNLLLYFQKDSLAEQVKYGDILYINARVTEVQPPGNPHQFNYKKFLANSGIYHQAYLKQGVWQKSGDRKVNPVFQLAYAARFGLLDILNHNGLKGDEFAVVSAILLGYDDFMDRELRNKYAGAGALHVLCVSGLHVGIIFLLLSFLLKPLDKKSALRIVKVVLILISIWAYAFITGLSPSVMRAGVMFSLFAIREVSREKSNPYNILAASAFILLLIDPFMITKIGFQLSYAAVLAIVSLFNPIYKLLPVKNVILDYFWKLTVVSLAAQIGTFPFAIFYFHQFPVYFFLTNIIVIPLVWLILHTGILVLVASAFSGFVAAFLGTVLSIMLLALNSSVDFINSLPGATISNLVITLGQVIVIYGIIIMLNRSYINRSATQFMVATTLFMFLSVSFLNRGLQKINQDEMVVYQINGATGIDFIHRDRVVFMADSTLLSNPGAMEFNISGNRIFNGIRNVQAVDLGAMGSSDLNLNAYVKFIEPCFLQFNDKKLAVVGPGHPVFNPAKPLNLDVLLLRSIPPYSIPELQKQFNFNRVVFDPSVNFWRLKNWKLYCDTTGLDYHDVRNDGYFRLASE
jgi:competence protein ComEC